jgi:hypothetical protein
LMAAALALGGLVAVAVTSCDKKAGGEPPAGAISCDEAGRTCSASNDDLRQRFGTTEVPSAYRFAMPYTDGAGYQAFSRCLDEAVAKRTTADALGCTERALAACAQTCEAAR